MRRVGVETTCSKCGRTLPKGAPNFYYNTRDRQAGKTCLDCSMPVWWNSETGKLDNAKDYENYNVETVAKFNGKCHVCQKPTVVGVTKITLCNDGVNWRHTYCSEVESVQIPNVPSFNNPVRAREDSIIISEPDAPSKVIDIPPVKTSTNGLSPITLAVWQEIEPLVQKKDSSSNTVNQAVQDAIELIEDCKRVQDELKEQLNKRPVHTLEVKLPDETTVSINDPHPMLAEVLIDVNSYFRGKRMIPYLYGKAGSGKTTLALQLAEALNLTFHTISLNRQSTPTVVMGFKDAMGVYQGTPYSDAWINGGIILIDEFDNASGNLLTSLNTGWANDITTFPHGQFKKHPNCILICAGNTAGRGADRQYNERQQLDAATLDRIVYEEIQYDEVLERKLALAECNTPEVDNWVTYVQKVRKNVDSTGVRHVVTPRASYYGAALLKSGKSLEKVINSALRKGLDADTWGKIK